VDEADEEDEFDEVDEADEEDESDEDESDEDEDLEEYEDEDEEGEEAKADEETPIFLGRKGKVYLFHSPDKLIEFVKSGAEHDLSQVDTWSTLVKRVNTDDIVPLHDHLDQ